MERIEDPIRFQRKPTLGEMALRRPPPASKQDTEASMVSATGYEEGGGEGYDYGYGESKGYGYDYDGVSVGVRDYVDECEAGGGGVSGGGGKFDDDDDEGTYLTTDLSAIGVKSGVFGYGAYSMSDEDQTDEQSNLLQWGEKTPERPPQGKSPGN